MNKILAMLLFVTAIFYGCSGPSPVSIASTPEPEKISWKFKEKWQTYGGMKYLSLYNAVPSSTTLTTVKADHVFSISNNYFPLQKGVTPSNEVPAVDFGRIAFIATLSIPKPGQYYPGDIQSASYNNWNNLLDSIPNNFSPTHVYFKFYSASQHTPANANFTQVFPEKYNFKIAIADMKRVSDANVGTNRKFNKYQITLCFNKDILSFGTKIRVNDFYISDGERTYKIPFSFGNTDYATENNGLDAVAKLNWAKNPAAQTKIDCFNAVTMKINRTQKKIQFKFDCPQLTETIKTVQFSGKYYDSQWNEYPFFFGDNKLVFKPREGEALKLIDYRATKNPSRRTFYTFLHLQEIPADVWRIVINDVRINGKRKGGILVPVISQDTFPQAEFDQPLTEKVRF